MATQMEDLGKLITGGTNAILLVDGIQIGMTDFKVNLKRNSIVQERASYSTPLKAPGMADISMTFTNITPNYSHLNLLLADSKVTGLKLDLEDCDASGNWAVGAATSVLSIETNIKKEGTGSLKIVNTDASGNTITGTISAKDLSGYGIIAFWVRSSLAGAIMTFGYGESAITENSEAITITKADTWQLVMVDISALADTSKNAITVVGFTMTSDAALDTETIYVDGIAAHKGVTFGEGMYFDLMHVIEDPADSNNFQMLYAPDCYFESLELGFASAGKNIVQPMAVGIKDASKIQYFSPTTIT